MKKLLKIQLITALLLLPLSAFSAPDYWIDVRSAKEFSTGHVAAAINIPHTEIAARISEVTTNKDADIYVYCRSGNRAGKALNSLSNMGYSQIRNIGGIDDALALEQKLAQ